jgi:putative chitinase
MNLTLQDIRDFGVKVDMSPYLSDLNKYLAEFQINTPKRISFFFSNILHEAGDFKYKEEIASGVDYEGRIDLGNTQKGDGKKFKGRTWMMVTGRYNYGELTNWCKKRVTGFADDFVKNPELLTTPRYIVLATFWFWDAKNLNKWSDEDKFREVCSIINTGKPDSITINGWADRELKRKKIEKWLTNLVLKADS